MAESGVQMVEGRTQVLQPDQETPAEVCSAEFQNCFAPVTPFYLSFSFPSLTKNSVVTL